jgi:hypothetical protein
MYAIGIPLFGPFESVMYHVRRTDLRLGLDCFADAVRLLMHLNALTLLPDHAESEALVIYSCRDRPKHAGISLPEGRVRSKWGVDGFVWEHGLWEVPVKYGRQVALFKMVSETRIRKALLLLAYSKGTLPDYDRAQIEDLAAQTGIAFGVPIAGF